MFAVNAFESSGLDDELVTNVRIIH